MQKKKKIKQILLRIGAALLALTIIISFIYGTLMPTVSAEEIEKLNVVYFYSEKCLTCKENANFIADLEKQTGVNLIKYDTTKDECSGLQVTFAKGFGVSQNYALQVPYIYYADKAYNLTPTLYGQVNKEILEYTSGNKKFSNFEYTSGACKDGLEEVKNKLSLSGIMLAGLMDGINPCAISMLLIFFSFLAFCDKKRKVIIIAASFILGLFAVNFTFGLGINTFYNLIAGNNVVIGILFGLSIVLCLLALIINTIDITNHYKNSPNDAKNQLPDRTKFKLVDIMKKAIFSKWAFIAALLSGFLIGGVELACTGQIYLPTLTYMIATDTDISSIVLLLIYNIMYILPLIAVTVAASIVRDAEAVKKAIMNKNHIIKIAANIFFIVMIIIMGIQLKSIF